METLLTICFLPFFILITFGFIFSMVAFFAAKKSEHLLGQFELAVAWVEAVEDKKNTQLTTNHIEFSTPTIQPRPVDIGLCLEIVSRLNNLKHKKEAHPGPNALHTRGPEGRWYVSSDMYEDCIVSGTIFVN